MPEPAHTGVVSLLVGFLMIAEGAAIALLSVSFVATPNILSVMALVAIASGGAICWSGAALAGFITASRKAAAIVALVLGVVIAAISFLVMVFGACAGGMACPASMPQHVYTLPIAFAAFNAACAALLWWRRRT